MIAREPTLARIATAQSLLLDPFGLDESHLRKALGEIMSHGVDDADLYFQYTRSEGWSLEEGIVKTGSFSIDQGVGVRAVSGEKTAFAYSDDLSWDSLLDAAHTVRSISGQGQSKKVKTPASKVAKSRSLYGGVDPIGTLDSTAKVALLEKVEKMAKAKDPRVVQVMAGLAAEHDVVLVARADGTLAADVRPLVRLMLRKGVTYTMFADLLKEVYRHVTVQKVAEVLQRLVGERISVRNLKLILESLAYWASREKDVLALVEHIRGTMARYISNKFAQGNDLRVLLLSPEFEDVVRRGIRQTSGGSFINLEPADAEELMDRLSVGLDNLHIAHKDMVLLCSVDVRRYLKKLIEGRWLSASAVVGLYPANTVRDDDIELYTDESRSEVALTWHGLRQQTEKHEFEGAMRPSRCLSDFVAPKGVANDYVGVFAVTAGLGVEKKEKQFIDDLDDYSAIMLKALADRMAEALAECLHHRVRTDLWGYAADEALSNEDLIKEKYQGIRPAPGYPACPDHLVKRPMFDLLQCEDIGMGLTESLAMTPAASVSGFYLAHPQSTYFNVGKIGEDQVDDLAERSAVARNELERWLAPNL